MTYYTSNRPWLWNNLSAMNCSYIMSVGRNSSEMALLSSKSQTITWTKRRLETEPWDAAIQTSPQAGWQGDLYNHLYDHFIRPGINSAVISTISHHCVISWDSLLSLHCNTLSNTFHKKKMWSMIFFLIVNSQWVPNVNHQLVLPGSQICFIFHSIIVLDLEPSFKSWRNPGRLVNYLT